MKWKIPHPKSSTRQGSYSDSTEKPKVLHTKGKRTQHYLNSFTSLKSNSLGGKHKRIKEITKTNPKTNNKLVIGNIYQLLS